MSQPEWTKKPLAQMTQAEWEALCDGCGLCCKHRITHPDTGREVRSNVACWLLDCNTVRCSRYDDRMTLNPGCVTLTPENLERVYWLPRTCAYKKIAAGEPLAEWHYLVCGDREAVHRAGISKRDEILPEQEYRRMMRYYDDYDVPEQKS